ncbi:sensor histidine kinase [Yoonia litorea]|uniref:histidine kinase n=1 Tax=Yoonia litorea TaxID=1123755 RepID=A0A1I6MVC2_9RHOB|nr:ATP-binding protein [Yoonia litorea]SFS19567.1 two-component system, NtrC family, C4-dicarboxylate transport sensor histidine kinase DctB [Yoonia litorea]
MDQTLSHTQNPQATRRAIQLLAAVAVLIALSAAGFAGLSSFFQAEKLRETPARAQFFAGAIDDALSRLAHLPYVLSIDPGTLAALRTGDADRLNPTLAAIAERSGAEFVFLMDTNGKTLASSNYDDADSLVGRYYTFRPYFREAMEGRQGRFYAVGVTTGRPGYFIAEPVKDESGTTFGVVVVKVPVRDLSRTIVDSGDLVLVTNREGVVLAASEPDFVYGLVAPLDSNAANRLEEQQQFGNKLLRPLDWQVHDDGRLTLAGVSYLRTPAALAQEDWTVHLLSNVADIRRQALLFVAIALTATLSLIIAAALWRASQLRRALAISDADRLRLETEISDRKIAEAKLEKARAELSRKNRLAALGQLSASITHELGQPISAMRNYLTAEEIARDAVPGSFAPQLTGLVERMQRIVDQLRLFGRNDPAQMGSFVVQDAVENALTLVKHTAEAANVSVAVDLASDPLKTRGLSTRFEQVIVNLLRNAIDAVEGESEGRIELRLMDADEIILEVADNGRGLGDLRMEDLSEPFFSTKPSGEGMGLGLAISAQIINEMGGTLDARTGVGGGAIFSVRLPRVG